MNDDRDTGERGRPPQQRDVVAGLAKSARFVRAITILIMAVAALVVALAHLGTAVAGLF